MGKEKADCGGVLALSWRVQSRACNQELGHIKYQHDIVRFQSCKGHDK